MRSLPVEPESDRVAIGGRIRAARQKQSMSMESLAAVTGLTKSFLSRVERDLTSPSVSSLVRICQVLSLDIGSLFREPELHLIRAGAGPTINLGGVGATERLLTSRQESRIQVIRSVVAAGGHGGHDLYTVMSEVEVAYIISGTIEMQFTQDTIVLAAGDALTFQGVEPHTWRNPSGSETAEMLWVLAPAAWSGAS